MIYTFRSVALVRVDVRLFVSQWCAGPVDPFSHGRFLTSEVVNDAFYPFVGRPDGEHELALGYARSSVLYMTGQGLS